eukprot:3744860-Ditylum_brightwellii.AAC.1
MDASEPMEEKIESIQDNKDSASQLDSGGNATISEEKNKDIDGEEADTADNMILPTYTPLPPLNQSESSRLEE